MKRVLLCLLLTCGFAQAQTVQQSGVVTPGHAVRWIAPGVIADGGTAAVGFLTSVGVVASGPGICQASGPQTGAYNLICLSASSTGGQITFNNFNGATGGLSFTVNGTPQAFPSVGLPTVAADAVCFLNTSGQLTDCGGSPNLLPIPTAITTTKNTSSTDCGKYFQLGGAAFYTFTINAVGGYPSGCQITVFNVDTVRGKGLSVNGLASTPIRLFPGQGYTFTNSGTKWLANHGPELWTTPSTFYVNFTSGSDSALTSDCLATGAGACKTFQNAVNIAQQNVFPGTPAGSNISSGVGVTIQADCESLYTQTALGAASSIQVYRWPGGLINFVGNAVTPLSCAILPTTTTTIFDVQDGAQATISGFELGFTGGSGSIAVSSRQLTITDVSSVYFANNSAGTQVAATDLASVSVSSVILNGTADTFVAATNKAVVQVNGVTVPGAGLASFTQWYEVIDAEIEGAPAYTITGTAAGSKYACAYNGVLVLSTAYPGALTAGSGGGNGVPGNTGCQTVPF